MQASEIPNWWQFALLALAVFRIYRLIAEDTVLERPRRAILRLDPDWAKEGDFAGDNYRAEWGYFITCPWCLGFWLSVAVWVGWLVFPTESVWLAVPWALSAIVALIAKNLDKAEES